MRARVLIADDHEDTATSLSLLLERWGYSVQVASAGVVALERMESFWPDVVLLDIGMPVMDGYEVARRIRQLSRIHEARPRPHLVAMTAYGYGDAIRRVREAGFDSYLAKPLDPDRLQRFLLALFR